MVEATRRAFLGGIAAIPFPAAATSKQRDLAPPSREELEHYYAFLWLEHRAVARVLDVEERDASVAHESGGVEAYREMFGSRSPEERARAVMMAVMLEKDSRASDPQMS